MTTDWQTKTANEIIEFWGSGDSGLTDKEAARRLGEYGLNELPAAKTDGLIKIFFRQFQSPLIYILLGAGLIVLALGEVADGGIIFFVLLFNAVIGTIQEGKAQNALAALKHFAQTQATVFRQGAELIIPDARIVPGDVLILQEGEQVPADARVILGQNLKVDEAALTGESTPVSKIAEPAKETEEAKNLLFKGTYLVTGHGQAVVVATGPRTAIGQIAEKIAGLDTEIPLKTNIRYLSRLILAAAGVTSAGLFLIGLALGQPLKIMFLTVVSLSVSIIPEGLPVVVTLVLTTGVWRMAKRQALVKRLQAVEALGQARVIAVDKTGTITKNELMVQKLYVDGEFFEVGGNGYEPKGEIRRNGAVIRPDEHLGLNWLGQNAALCANANVVWLAESAEWKVSGDPTEAALLVIGQKLGLSKPELERTTPLVAEIPFDYRLKYHATLHQPLDHPISANRLTVIGAPEVILGLSSKIWRRGGATDDRPLDGKTREKLEQIFHHWSRQGLRVLAAASATDVNPHLRPEDLGQLTFIGYLGMRDTLRPEVAAALSRARAAGIRVIMITGDHRLTAQAIAEAAGIFRAGDQLLTGKELNELEDEELSERLAPTAPGRARVSVFARVTPEHKLRIIQAFRRRGEIVAMTGDGVNDAPSLVAADLGVAMGKIGTAVAKEASDIVLLDDNFGTIIAAVEEGRGIYQTIKKVILYLFSTSAGEILTLTGAVVLTYPLPLLPVQIIWLNLVTDGFLIAALALEPKETGLLSGNFERPKKYLLDKLMGWRMVVMALPMMIGTLLLFKNYLAGDFARAATVALTTLAVFQWFNAWNCRSATKSILRPNPWSNKFLLGATAIIIGLQLLAVYHPWGQKILGTAPLTLTDWLIIVPVAATIVAAEEIRKFFYRRRLAPSKNHLDTDRE